MNNIQNLNNSKNDLLDDVRRNVFKGDRTPNALGFLIIYIVLFDHISNSMNNVIYDEMCGVFVE